ncbi:MAG: hypothetical protein QGG74_00410 [Phycisphaerales bacterium]|jgi:DUF4097 and DUF4098 domain-containing protein YvlB|nr:hypothetical protein [Phycisphaerales bacterium]
MHTYVRLARRSAIGVLLAVGLIGCDFGPKFTAKATRTTTKDSTTAKIDAKTTTGSIDVSGGSTRTNTTIIAELTCGGKTQQEADERLAKSTLDATTEPDGTILIRVSFPAPRQNGDSVAVQATVPNLTGAMLRTNTGSISVSHANGPIDAKTNTGSIKISGCSGEVLARGNTGKIAVSTHTGQIDAATDTGSVSIELTDQSAGTVTGETDTGSVSLSVGPAFNGIITTHTGFGSVKLSGDSSRITRSDLQKHDGVVTIGSGGEKSSLRTDTGSIDINVR